MVTDAERTEKMQHFFIRCSSSEESRLDGDEGLCGACEELIKMNPMNIIYIVLYLNIIQPSHVKQTIKTVYLLHIITLFHFALS